MSIISTIYKAPVIATSISESIGSVVMIIKYNNKWYDGEAMCHPDEFEFFSPRVGKNIAKSRARLKILKEEWEKAQQICRVKLGMLNELKNLEHHSWEEIDPTGRVYQNIKRAQLNELRLKMAYKKEKEKLNNYLEGQDRMVDSVKLHRRLEQEDKDN